MTGAQVVWTGARAPTPAELRAIGAAWRAGMLRPGDRVSCRAAPAAARAPSRARPPAQPRRRRNPSSEYQDYRVRIGKLQYDLRKAKAQSRSEVARLRARRDLSRPKLEAEIKRFRAKWRAWVNEQVSKRRIRHRGYWAGKIAAAQAEVRQIQAEITAERGYRRDLLSVRASQSKARKAAPQRKRVARFHAAESDYEVEQNIDPELVPIWRKVKHRIKTRTARKTRTEAFQEWVSENRREVEAMRAEMFDPDDLEAELMAQESAHYRGAA